MAKESVCSDALHSAYRGLKGKTVSGETLWYGLARIHLRRPRVQHLGEGVDRLSSSGGSGGSGTTEPYTILRRGGLKPHRINRRALGEMP